MFDKVPSSERANAILLLQHIIERARHLIEELEQGKEV